MLLQPWKTGAAGPRCLTRADRHQCRLHTLPIHIFDRVSLWVSVFTGAAEADLQHPDLPHVQPHPPAAGLPGGHRVRVCTLPLVFLVLPESVSLGVSHCLRPSAASRKVMTSSCRAWASWPTCAVTTTQCRATSSLW